MHRLRSAFQETVRPCVSPSCVLSVRVSLAVILNHAQELRILPWNPARLMTNASNAQTALGFSRDRQALRPTVVHSTLMPRAKLRSIGPSLNWSNVVQLHVRLSSLPMQPVSKTCTVLVTVLKNWNTVRTWVPSILRTSPFWIGWSSPPPNASFSGWIRIKLWMRC